MEYDNSNDRDPLEIAHGADFALRIVTKAMAGLTSARQWLALVDTNLHEGMLRASVMPAEFMQIPDFILSSLEQDPEV